MRVLQVAQTCFDEVSLTLTITRIAESDSGLEAHPVYPPVDFPVWDERDIAAEVFYNVRVK